MLTMHSYRPETGFGAEDSWIQKYILDAGTQSEEDAMRKQQAILEDEAAYNEEARRRSQPKPTTKPTVSTPAPKKPAPVIVVQPFYEKWQFWLAVVGSVVVVGTGSYLIFRRT